MFRFSVAAFYALAKRCFYRRTRFHHCELKVRLLVLHFRPQLETIVYWVFRGSACSRDTVNVLQHIYAIIEATLAMKERALAKTSPSHGRPGRYQPGDQLLGFLNSL